MRTEHTERTRRDAWARLCVDLYPRLLAMARALTRNDVHSTEDLVQQTVLRCLTYAPDLEKIKEPKSYLRRSMRNIWIDSRHKHDEISLDDPLMSELPETALLFVEPDVLRSLENEELRKTLREKQGPLTIYENRLLSLHLDGYTINEIANLLHEDVHRTRYNLNALKTKVRYRVKQKGKREAA